jgi:hypothetical protein
VSRDGGRPERTRFGARLGELVRVLLPLLLLLAALLLTYRVLSGSSLW